MITTRTRSIQFPCRRNRQPLFWMLALLIPCLAIPGDAYESPDHDCATRVANMVDAALVDGASKDSFFDAEAGLAGLGWLMLYGNSDEFRLLGDRLMEVAGASYEGFTGSESESEEYRNRFNRIATEISNLNRFDKTPLAPPSPEYAQIVRERVDSAISAGPGSGVDALAEGSLVALGWLTLYVNDAASLGRAGKMADAAAALWGSINETYMTWSSGNYASSLPGSTCVTSRRPNPVSSRNWNLVQRLRSWDWVRLASLWMDSLTTGSRSAQISAPNPATPVFCSGVPLSGLVRS